MKAILKTLALTFSLALILPNAVLAACADITDNTSVDTACCVDPASVGSGNTTDETYLNCVSQKVFDLSLSDSISSEEGDAIITKAGEAGVN
jgi:hypothetical protein